MLKTSILAAIACVLASQSIAQTTTTPPNIIVIQADDLHVDLFKREFMPQTFARLYDAGLTITGFHTNTATCGPNRAQLETAQLGRTNGLTLCRDDDGKSEDFAEYINRGSHTRSIGVAFRQAGYFTGHIGRKIPGYGSAVVMARAGLSQYEKLPGWHRWVATMDMKFHNPPMVIQKDYVASVPGFVSDIIADQAKITFERALAVGKPAFLLLTPPNPHVSVHGTTYTPECFAQHAGAVLPRNADDWDSLHENAHPGLVANVQPMSAAKIAQTEAAYPEAGASLCDLDRMFANIHDMVAANGQLGNTIFVFTSDGGLYRGNKSFPTGKSAPYPQVTHIPFVIAGPGIPANVRRNYQMTTIDIMPSLLGLAGIVQQPQFHGQNYDAMLKGLDCGPKHAFITARSSSTRPVFNGATFNYHYDAARTKNKLLVIWNDPIYGLVEEFFNRKVDGSFDRRASRNTITESQSSDTAMLRTVISTMQYCTSQAECSRPVHGPACL